MSAYTSTLLIPFSGTTSKLTVNYDQPIRLNPKKQYVAGIIGGYLPVSWPNITSINNTLKISSDNGTSWTTITVPIGQYDVNTIGAYLRDMETTTYAGATRPFIVAGDSTIDPADDVVGISIFYDAPSMKTVVRLYNNFHIDLASMGTLLGWANNTKIDVKNVNNYSPNIPRVEGTYKYYNITCDILEAQPKPNSRSATVKILYTNTPDVAPGTIQSLPQTNNVVWVPIDQIKKEINDVVCQLTDQDGSPLDIRGQNIYLSVMVTET